MYICIYNNDDALSHVNVLPLYCTFDVLEFELGGEENVARDI